MTNTAILSCLAVASKGSSTTTSLKRPPDVEALCASVFGEI